MQKLTEKPVIWTGEASEIGELSAISLPCVEYAFLQAKMVESDVVLATSARIGFFFQENAHYFKNKPIYTFSEKLEKSLSSLDFSVKLISAESAQDFSKKLPGHISQKQSLCFYGAKDLASDWLNDLRQQGFAVNHVVCYQTKTLDVSQKLETIFKNHPNGVKFCFGSPAAVKAVNFANADVKEYLRKYCDAYVLGRTTEEEAKRIFRQVLISPQQKINALLSFAIKTNG